MVDFSNNDEARRWFEGQPREVAVVIASRIALRTLPLVVVTDRLGMPDSRSRFFFNAIALPCFRASAASWIAARFGPLGANFGDAAAGAADKAARAASFAAAAVVAAAKAAARANARVDAAGAALTVARAAARAALRADPEVAYDYFGVADSIDSAFIDTGETVERRFALAADLSRRPLWPEVPARIAEAWSRLKAMLLDRADEHWEVWTDWYEDRLAGCPADRDLEVARVLLPDELWEKGAKAVNAEIRRLIDERRSQDPSPDSIPVQGAGPHFMLGPAGPITLAPASEIDSEGNNIGRIRQLLPLVRRAADDLSGHLNPNQFKELARDVADYRAAIADDAAIAWGIVFGLGVMLENAAVAAGRHLDDPLWPRLEDAPKARLAALLTLHGPLVLATAEGRELADDADRMRLSREEQGRRRLEAAALARALREDADVADPSAAELVEKAADAIGEGRHPERATTFGLAAIKNITIVLIAAAAVTVVASDVNVLMGLAAGTSAGWLGWEGLKKSKVFLQAAESLGGGLNRLVKLGEDQADLARAQIVARLQALAPFRAFVIRNEAPLREIAANASAMHWMLGYIDFIVRTDPERRAG